MYGMLFSEQDERPDLYRKWRMVEQEKVDRLICTAIFL